MSNALTIIVSTALMLSGAATEARLAELARLKAAAPLRPVKPQIPCDVGLFGDDSLQTDLVEMLTYSHEE